MENKFSRRLKLLRIKRRLSQKQLANDIGVSRTTVTSWENGPRTPTIPTLRRIALYFNVSSDYLVGRCDSETNVVAVPASSMDLSKLNSEGLDMLFEYYRYLTNDDKYHS